MYVVKYVHIFTRFMNNVKELRLFSNLLCEIKKSKDL